MFQRIQSVYLILAIILMSSLLFFDLACISKSYDCLIINIYGVYLRKVDGLIFQNPLIALLILYIITELALVTSLFSFKKRMFQLRICGINIALLSGIILMTFYLGLKIANESNMSFSPMPSIGCPFVAIILNILAMRRIWKDEKLVNSIDRIR